MQLYKPPKFNESAFNCPHCNAYAHQTWKYMKKRVIMGVLPADELINNGFITECANCKKEAFWIDQVLIYPLSSPAPLPNNDLPDDIKKDFEEARKIVQQSPRGACALLRLCIQKLCVEIGEKGENINDDIGSMVKKGLLSLKIQKALDIVRIVGNNAVHPGEIDVKDDYNTALKLFDLVNIIVNEMITTPREIDGLFEKLPEGAKKQIARRDTDTNKTQSSP